mmetsp:Transcript_129/g.458  ORF Transcript_129/g.458 Transcript_129/m.458 type:complete len:329 (+) Transcript_129:620-1606(+)
MLRHGSYGVELSTIFSQDPEDVGDKNHPTYVTTLLCKHWHARETLHHERSHSLLRQPLTNFQHLHLRERRHDTRVVHFLVRKLKHTFDFFDLISAELISRESFNVSLLESGMAVDIMTQEPVQNHTDRVHNWCEGKFDRFHEGREERGNCQLVPTSKNRRWEDFAEAEHQRDGEDHCEPIGQDTLKEHWHGLVGASIEQQKRHQHIMMVRGVQSASAIALGHPLLGHHRMNCLSVLLVLLELLHLSREEFLWYLEFQIFFTHPDDAQQILFVQTVEAHGEASGERCQADAKTSHEQTRPPPCRKRLRQSAVFHPLKLSVVHEKLTVAQ